MGIRVKPDLTGEEEFPNEALYDVARHLEYLIHGIVLNTDWEIAVEQNKSRISFEIHFDDPKNVALLIGPKFRVINAILTMLRFQQYFPHNRWIEVHLHKAGGEVQTVVDRKVFLKGRD